MKKEKREYFPAVLVSLAFVILILLPSCKKDNPVIPPVEPPPVVKDTITLSAEGTTHRSIELKVQSTTNDSSLKIKLFRVFNSAETMISEYPILAKDTAIIDDDNGNGLQLNTEYSYYAVTVDTSGEVKDTSNQITAGTLAATSHNYTWQEYDIGNWQSVLYDVWGTDENNVYAVGFVAINDTAFSIWHWDGTEWNPVLTKAGGTAIYGFSATDIWTLGGSIFHYDGVTWEEILFKNRVLVDNIPYTTLWGTSSNDMYFGNTRGKIIHWDGTKAEIIYDTGGYYITDIYGTGPDNIWVCGGRTSGNWDNLLLHYDGYTWIEDNSLPIPILQAGSILSFNPRENYIVGNRILQGYTDHWTQIPGGLSYGAGCVRGDNSNNIFASGAFGFIIHFNGIDWHIYTELSTPSGGVLHGIFPIGNKVFAVGYNEDHSAAKIIIGTKN